MNFFNYRNIILYEKPKEPEFLGKSSIDVRKNQIKDNLEKLTSDFNKFKKSIEKIEKKDNTKDKELLSQMKNWTKDQIIMNDKYREHTLDFLGKHDDIYELKNCMTNVEAHMKVKQGLINDIKNLYKAEKEQYKNIKLKKDHVRKNLETIKLNLENFKQDIQLLKTKDKPTEGSEAKIVLSQMEDWAKNETVINEKHQEETSQFLEKNNNIGQISDCAKRVELRKERMKEWFKNSENLYKESKSKDKKMQSTNQDPEKIIDLSKVKGPINQNDIEETTGYRF